MTNKIILIFLIVFTFFSLSAKDRVLVRFSSPNDFLVKEIMEIGYDIAAYKKGEYLDIIVSKEVYKKFIDSGYDCFIRQTIEQSEENMRTGRDLVGYRNYDDLLLELQQIESEYPAICQLLDVGDSWGKIYADAGNSYYDYYNHEILALKVSDNVMTEEDEPSIYYMGTHHAREPISLEVTMAILYHILENYGTDQAITDNVNNSQIWFVPLVNPNGHKVVTDESDVWWRKNIRDNNENGQFDNYGDHGPDGVDPNRNYGFHWGSVGTSDDWYSEVYNGPEAWSEPEVQAMKELLETHHFVAGISYHSYSELVLFPFGYSEGVVAPDHDALEELAVDMAQTIPAEGGGYYTPQESWQLYACMGTTDDYAYGVHGSFSYTIEIGTEFIPPANQVEEICEDHIQAAMILLDRPTHSVITGNITDQSTGNPLSAEIFIPGIDDTGVEKEPFRSDINFGRYYRLLQNGSYAISFYRYGYETQTFDNIQVSDDGQTVLDVTMNPVDHTDFSGIVLDAENGEPISDASIQILNTPIESETSDENGEFYFADVCLGTYQVRITAENYSTCLNEVTINSENNYLTVELAESVAESFEEGTFPDEWLSGGDAGWIIDESDAYDGNYSVQSGAIGSWDNSDLSIELNVTSSGEISFFQKASSEADYDFLKFYIDGVAQGQWSGETDWNYENFSVSSGEHNFLWSYEKDGYVSDGEDCGWLDYITFPPSDYFTLSEDQTLSSLTKLTGNFPNPFRSATTISFQMGNDHNQPNELSIYNLKGQKVKTFTSDRFTDSPVNHIIWNGTDDSYNPVSSGIYFYKLKSAGNSISTRKMILLR